MPVRPPLRDYRTWIIDSRRWQHYRPRPDDIVISTYPKCGTTWTQRIVSLLVFQTTETIPLMNISAWVDRRIPEPVEAVMATIEAQEHRRFLKAHLPADGLPIHGEVRYIHTARDGRDACISFHNHGTGMVPQMYEAMDRVGMEDETIGRPYPRLAEDPADHFHNWLTRGEVQGHPDGTPAMSFFAFEKTWWDLRDRENVLMVHYNDLKADLPGEMARIAAFLGIDVSGEKLQELAGAAGFGEMSRNSDALLGKVAGIFQGGGERFFRKGGTNQRWRGVYRDEDLALYNAKLAKLPPDCREWVTHGRLATA